MPRVTINSTNFTAGEVSPKCYGRVDLARYQNGAKYMPNCLVDIHGGAVRRPGSIYIAEVKDSTKRVRLIPYVFSTTQAYILEFGDLYMRVYEQSGGQILSLGVPYEIVTPYTEAMLDELDYTQGADTMFLFHNQVPVNILKRVANDFWSIGPAPFSVEPFAEVGHTFAQDLNLSFLTVGAGASLTTAGFTFQASDVGRRVRHETGLATITSYLSSTSVVATITSPFSVTPVPAGDWELLDSPQTDVTPSAQGPIGAGVTLAAGVSAWRLADVGKFVRINGGLVQITTFLSVLNVTGIIKQELSSVTAAPASSWTLESTVWTPANGYPSTGVLYEQRLILAGSVAYPNTIWGSRSGLFFDFTIGVDDADAFSFTLPSTGQINPIQRMTSANALMPLTYGGEYTMQGGDQNPLTPTNVKAKSPSVYGCNLTKPLRVGNEVLFVQRAGRKIRSLAYRIETDTYSAPDLTVLAEHITTSGVTEMAYQQEPGAILWCLLNNGTMATMTLDRDEGVTAWTRQSTENGLYESVASVPNDTGDEVWVSVRRLVNNGFVRYVERFDATRYTDSGITGQSIGGSSVWANLDHLEGEDVAVKADGVYMGLFTVTGGEITLPRDAFVVEIGLPFTNYVTLLRPEIQAGDGTAQGNPSRTHEVSLLISDTIGMKLNGEEIAFREFGPDLLDEAPAAFSGFKRAGLTGWVRGDEQEITISQDEPYPFELLAVVRKFTVNS